MIASSWSRATELNSLVACTSILSSTDYPDTHSTCWSHTWIHHGKRTSIILHVSPLYYPPSTPLGSVMLWIVNTDNSDLYQVTWHRWERDNVGVRIPELRHPISHLPSIKKIRKLNDHICFVGFQIGWWRILNPADSDDSWINFLMEWEQGWQDNFKFYCLWV